MYSISQYLSQLRDLVKSSAYPDAKSQVQKYKQMRNKGEIERRNEKRKDAFGRRERKRKI
jgi:hypothetical protein